MTTTTNLSSLSTKERLPLDLSDRKNSVKDKINLFERIVPPLRDLNNIQGHPVLNSSKTQAHVMIKAKPPVEPPVRDSSPASSQKFATPSKDIPENKAQMESLIGSYDSLKMDSHEALVYLLKNGRKEFMRDPNDIEQFKRALLLQELYLKILKICWQIEGADVLKVGRNSPMNEGELMLSMIQKLSKKILLRFSEDLLSKANKKILHLLPEWNLVDQKMLAQVKSLRLMFPPKNLEDKGKDRPRSYSLSALPTPSHVSFVSHSLSPKKSMTRIEMERVDDKMNENTDRLHKGLLEELKLLKGHRTAIVNINKIIRALRDNLSQEQPFKIESLNIDKNHSWQKILSEHLPKIEKGQEPEVLKRVLSVLEVFLDHVYLNSLWREAVQVRIKEVIDINSINDQSPTVAQYLTGLYKDHNIQISDLERALEFNKIQIFDVDKNEIDLAAGKDVFSMFMLILDVFSEHWFDQKSLLRHLTLRLGNMQSHHDLHQEKMKKTENEDKTEGALKLNLCYMQLITLIKALKKNNKNENRLPTSKSFDSIPFVKNDFKTEDLTQDALMQLEKLLSEFSNYPRVDLLTALEYLQIVFTFSRQSVVYGLQDYIVTKKALTFKTLRNTGSKQSQDNQLHIEVQLLEGRKVEFKYYRKDWSVASGALLQQNYSMVVGGPIEIQDKAKGINNKGRVVKFMVPHVGIPIDLHSHEMKFSCSPEIYKEKSELNEFEIQIGQIMQSLNLNPLKVEITEDAEQNSNNPNTNR